jgi:MoaA/NifB/PqqE/SkfB family radical SAM enzyme
MTPGALWKILATTNMMVVRFEGDGEPTCNPHFKELVKMCGDLGVRSAMTCNATLLNKEYVDYLAKYGMSRIHVSFDGAKKDTFEKQRLGADYEKVLYNCKLIAKSRIQLFMNVLLSSDEVVDQLPLYAKMAKDVGATGVHFMKYQAENLTQWRPPDLTRHVGAIKAFEIEAKRLGLLYVSTCREFPTYVGCDDPFVCPYILLNNDVYACSYMANLRRTEVYQSEVFPVPYLNYKMGNLEDSWMKDVWNNDLYKELRQTLNRKPDTLEISSSTLAYTKKRAAVSSRRFAYCSGCLCIWGESGI